jgi:hypothetical protein
VQLRDDIRRASLKLARAYVAEVLQVRLTKYMRLLLLLLLLLIGHMLPVLGAQELRALAVDLVAALG